VIDFFIKKSLTFQPEIFHFAEATFCYSHCSPHSIKGALKQWPPISLCWPMMLEADSSDVALEVEPFCQQFVRFVAV
jgi:hypothetical protein